MRPASRAVFSRMEPQERGADGKSRTWITRAGNFAVCVSEVEPGAVLERRAVLVEKLYSNSSEVIS